MTMNKEELNTLVADFDSWCINEGLLDDDMADAVGRFSEVRELSEEEYEELLTVR